MFKAVIAITLFITSALLTACAGKQVAVTDDSVKILSAGDRPYALRAISLGEEEGSSCFIQAEFRSLDDASRNGKGGGAENVMRKTYNACRSREYKKAMKSARLDFRGFDFYANEIRTCDKADDSGAVHVTDVQLSGALASGEVPEAKEYVCRKPGQEGIKNPEIAACKKEQLLETPVASKSCAKWNKRSCPPGSLADGVKVYLAANRDIVGLALKCQNSQLAGEPKQDKGA